MYTDDDLWQLVVQLNYSNENAPFSKVAKTLPAQGSLVQLNNKNALFYKFTILLIALDE